MLRTPIFIIRLKPSTRLTVMLSFAHLVAIVLLWPLTLPTAVKLSGSALLIFSLVFYLRRYALLRSPDSVSGLELTDEMVCILETQGGERIACALLGSSFVAPYLTVLELTPLKFDSAVELRESWRRFFSRSVVILPDGIDPEEFRRLRVLLRWKWKDMKDAD
jgi:toxin CptA